VRRSSSGISGPNLNLSWKEIQIRDTSMVLPMVEIGRNISILYYKMKDGLKAMSKLKSYITNYYKNLFGALEESSFSLDETQTDDSPTYLWRKMVY
jgi:hypothetical protein